jgi:hypothetical protein
MILNKKIILIVSFLALALMIAPVAVDAVTLKLNLNFNLTGIFLGFWHGLLAPYSLVLRWFIPGISMYSCGNVSWLYDFGFLIGIFFSLPLGWIAVIIALMLHLFA